MNDICTGIKTADGKDVLTYDFVQTLRAEDRKHPNRNRIMAQRGGQENILSSNADISIVGGSRGGSKSFSLLLEVLKDINNKNFKSIIFRNEIDDLSDLVDVSYDIYDRFGTYNKSKNDMTWNFNHGGWLKFSYHSGSMEDFDIRFRGKQYSYIGIDEITQIAYPKFKHLITCNRNASFIRNRFIGSCNPDPDSWVA